MNANRPIPLLRRGITGFGAQAEVEFAAFKKAVYAAALKAGARVVNFAAANSVTPNFHQADIQIGKHGFSVVCNCVFPIVAFVERPIGFGQSASAIDMAAFAEPIRDFGFQIATAAELGRPLEMADLQSLGENERQQVKYWKPKYVSQVVFNWWD